MITQGLVWGLVASQGFEPQYAESESAVLPLNDEAMLEIRKQRESGSDRRGTRDHKTHLCNHTRCNREGSIRRQSGRTQSGTRTYGWSRQAGIPARQLLGIPSSLCLLEASKQLRSHAAYQLLMNSLSRAY